MLHERRRPRAGLGDEGEGGGGGGGESWYSALPEDLKGHDHVTKYNDLPSFVQDSVNAQALIGKKGIIPPGEGSTIQDWDRYYEQLGRPTDVRTYQADQFGDDVAKLPESYPRDEELEKSMLQELYDSGVGKSTAKRIYNAFIKNQQQSIERIAGDYVSGQEQLDAMLDQEFGAARSEKMNSARRAWETLIGDKDKANEMLEIKLMDGRRIGDVPEIIKGMANLGGKMSDDGKFVEGQSAPMTLTPEEALGQLAEMQADVDLMKAVTVADHPNHGPALAKWQRLQRYAHPEAG